MRRSYVTISTENYHYLSLWLSKSIRKYSSLDLHVFCINYNPYQLGLEIPEGVFFHTIKYELEESGIKFKNLEDGNFYVNRNSLRSFQITTRKSHACLKTMEMGYDAVCYIDTDSLACPNVDEIFDFEKQISGVPLLSKGPHEFVIIPDDDGNEWGNPFINSWPNPDIKKTLEWPLMEFLGVDVNQRTEYRTSNLFLANRTCIPFLQTFEKFIDVLWRIADVWYYCPFQDETPMNVFVWKNRGSGLPMSYINLDRGLQTVKDFFELQFEEDTLIGDFLKIPKDKNQIKVLHGEKREQELEKIIQHLDFLKERGYYDTNL